MARRTILEKVEDLATDLEPGAAVEVEPRDGDHFPACVWSRDGLSKLARARGATRTAALTALHAELQAARA